MEILGCPYAQHFSELVLASPLIALYDIASAIEDRDAVALTERIDFPAVRRSLTKQIVQEYLKLTGKKLPLQAIGKRLMVSAADPIIARLMTVRALLDLLNKGDAGEQARLNSEYRGRSFSVYLPPSV